MNTNPSTPELPSVRLGRIAQIIVVLVLIGLAIGLVPRYYTRRALAAQDKSEAVPVVMIDGVKIADGQPGPLTRRIHGLYARKAGIQP